MKLGWIVILAAVAVQAGLPAAFPSAAVAGGHTQSVTIRVEGMT